MCLLHDQEQYGVSTWPLKEIAQAVGCPVAKLKSLVSKGILKGADTGAICDAFQYTPRSGRKSGPTIDLVPAQPGPLWYSSRMIIDEHKRLARGDQNDAPKVSPKPPFGDDIGAAPNTTPSSYAGVSPAAPSSSSSSSSSKEKTNAALPPFDPLPELAKRGVSDQTAADWTRFRKDRRAKVTATVVRDIIAEANKAGLSLERALTISCRRGWTGFEASWIKPEDRAAAEPPKKDWT